MHLHSLLLLSVLLSSALTLPHFFDKEDGEHTWSSFRIINIPQYNSSYPCSKHRVHLKNVMVENTNDAITITYFSPIFSPKPSSTLLNHAAVACCMKRSLSSKPITVKRVSHPLSLPFTSSNPLYMINAVHPSNFFHALVDLSTSLFYTMAMDNYSQSSVLLLKCPDAPFPFRYFDYLAPFTSEVVINQPKLFIVEDLFIGHDTTPVYCLKGKELVTGCASVFAAWKSLLVNYFHIQQSNHSQTKVTMLDRRPGNREVIEMRDREWRNEVKEKLQEYNITIDFVNTGKLSTLKQLEIALNSDILFGTHGAGLVLELFQPDCSVAIVLNPPNCFNYVYENIPKRLGRGVVSKIVDADSVVVREGAKKWLFQNGYPNNEEFFRKQLCHRFVRDVDFHLTVEEVVGLVLEGFALLDDYE
ncbi:hypothetical protein P9112_000267 [Eukaryota sp. TZLM1-RC]